MVVGLHTKATHSGKIYAQDLTIQYLFKIYTYLL